MIDVFRVGVHLGMTSNAPQMLGLIARHFAGIHANAKELEKSFGKVALAVGGVVSAMAGIGLVKGVWHAVEASRELNRELDRTAQLGGKLKIDPAVVKARAFATAEQVRTLDPAMAVKMERELAGQLGSHDKAFSVLPFAAKLAWNLQEFTGADSESAVRDAVKVADLRGNIFSRGASGEEEVDPKKLIAEMDAMARGVKASGGMLKPADYLAFAKQSGLAGKSMDPTAFYGWATEAMVAMGASRAGTAMSSLLQQFQGGTAPLHVWRAFEKLGIMKEGRDFVVEKGGHVTNTAEGRDRMHLADMKRNEFTWVNDTLIPMLEKAGVAKDDVLTKLTELLGRQTTQRLVGEAFQNRVQFARTADLFQNAQSVDSSAKDLHDKDFDTNARELQEAWKGFMQAMGDAGIPAAIGVLHSLTDGIHWMTRTVIAHPDAARRLLEFGAALGVVMTVGGTLAIISVAMGPFAAGIRLLSGAIKLGAGVEAAGLAGSLTTLFGIILRFAGPLGAVAAVMRPTALNAGEGESIARHRAMSPEQHRSSMDPSGWHPAVPHQGALDSLFDKLGITRSEGAPVTSVQPGGGGQSIQVHSTLQVDGRVLARTVNTVNARQMSGPSTGATGFDSRISPLQPGAGGL
ncbi:MAG: hypothetical protein ACRYG8_03475 [Janthinobacterium lividum]